MAKHVAHALLLLALVLQAWLLPAEHRVMAWVGTVLLFGGLIGFLVVSPTTQPFVRTQFRGDPASQAVAFSFDDGPDPIWTPKILEVLKQHQARATFFVVGARAALHPELVRQIAAEGHEVGCHGYSHSLGFHFWTARRMAADLGRAQQLLVQLLGAPARLFRPPQGIRTPQLETALAQLEPRPTCVTWSARGLDSRTQDHQRIVDRLLPALRPGNVLTLHDGTGLGGCDHRTETVRALQTLLDAARERGLRCLPVSEVLA